MFKYQVFVIADLKDFGNKKSPRKFGGFLECENSG